MSALPPIADIDRARWDVRFVPTADIRDDVNEKERPPCGGLSKAVRDVRYATWISGWPLRRCGSRPAQAVAGRASGRDWSPTRRLWRPCALQRSAAVRVGRCDLQWPRCTNSA